VETSVLEIESIPCTSWIFGSLWFINKSLIGELIRTEQMLIGHSVGVQKQSLWRGNLHFQGNSVHLLRMMIDFLFLE